MGMRNTCKIQVWEPLFVCLFPLL